MSCCHIVISCSGRVYFCAEALFLEQCLVLEWTPLLLENSQFGQEKGQWYDSLERNMLVLTLSEHEKIHGPPESGDQGSVTKTGKLTLL
jgi:hypothetical protein